jgi:hypothetical protein
MADEILKAMRNHRDEWKAESTARSLEAVKLSPKIVSGVVRVPMTFSRIPQTLLHGEKAVIGIIDEVLPQGGNNFIRGFRVHHIRYFSTEKNKRKPAASVFQTRIISSTRRETEPQCHATTEYNNTHYRELRKILALPIFPM